MAVITLDIEEGHSASHDLLSGWDLTRGCMVEDLAYSTSTDDLCAQALAALIAYPDPSAGTITGFIGDRGTQYRMGKGSGNGGVIGFLKTFITDVKSPNSVMVRIVYKGYPILTYEGGGSLNQIDSNIDVNGRTILLSYTYPSDYLDQNGNPSAKAGKRYVYSPIVSREEDEPVFKISFTITAGNLSANVRGIQYSLVNANATDIFSVIIMFKGTCNDAPYSIGVINGNRHQWKIVDATGHSEDQGVTYRCSMSFQFRESYWDKTETFINPDTGQSPPDPIVNTLDPTDDLWPLYAGLPPATLPDIGQTMCATVKESTFPSFGYWSNAGVINVNNPTSATNDATFPAVTN